MYLPCFESGRQFYSLKPNLMWYTVSDCSPKNHLGKLQLPQCGKGWRLGTQDQQRSFKLIGDFDLVNLFALPDFESFTWDLTLAIKCMGAANMVQIPINYEPSIWRQTIPAFFFDSAEVFPSFPFILARRGLHSLLHPEALLWLVSSGVVRVKDGLMQTAMPHC